MAVCQNLVPLVNIKIAAKWMFIPLKMVLIGIDPYPHAQNGNFPIWSHKSPSTLWTASVSRCHRWEVPHHRSGRVEHRCSLEECQPRTNKPWFTLWQTNIAMENHHF